MNQVMLEIVQKFQFASITATEDDVLQLTQSLTQKIQKLVISQFRYEKLKLKNLELEDLYQEVFLVILEIKDKYQSQKGNLDCFLTSSIRKRLKAYVRQEKKRQGLLVSSGSSSEILQNFCRDWWLTKGRLPTSQEIQLQLKWKPAKVTRVLWELASKQIACSYEELSNVSLVEEVQAQDLSQKLFFEQFVNHIKEILTQQEFALINYRFNLETASQPKKWTPKLQVDFNRVKRKLRRKVAIKDWL